MSNFSKQLNLGYSAKWFYTLCGTGLTAQPYGLMYFFKAFKKAAPSILLCMVFINVNGKMVLHNTILVLKRTKPWFGPVSFIYLNIFVFGYSIITYCPTFDIDYSEAIREEI